MKVNENWERWAMRNGEKKSEKTERQDLRMKNSEDMGKWDKKGTGKKRKRNIKRKSTEGKWGAEVR